jgi:alpha-ketoglutarate-dependent taurine dioxygenase
MRRQTLQSEHPVVIVHPVTKQKALCKFIPDLSVQCPGSNAHI